MAHGLVASLGSKQCITANRMHDLQFRHCFAGPAELRQFVDPFHLDQSAVYIETHSSRLPPYPLRISRPRFHYWHRAVP